MTNNRSQDSLKAIELFRKAIEYGKKNDPDQALDFFEKSLILRKKLYGDKNYRLGNTYVGIAIQYKNLHQLDNAYKYYKIAEEMYLFNAPPNDSRLGDIYTNIGNYFQLKGNLAEAIRYQERAVYIYDHSNDEISLENHLQVIYNLANSYHKVNREKEALELVLKNCRKGSIQRQIHYQNLLASIYDFLNQHKKANDIHLSIIRNLEKKSGEYNFLLANQFTYYGQFLNTYAGQDSAMVYFRKAEAMYKKFKHVENDLAELYLSIADSYSLKNIHASTLTAFRSEKNINLSEAVKMYYKAFELLNDTGNKPEVDFSVVKNTNSPILTLKILQKLGTTYQQLASLFENVDVKNKTENLTKAVTCFETGSDLTEFLRTGFISEESKLQFSEIQQHIFISAVEAAYELYQTTSDTRWAEIAFQNSERNKAASLLDQVSEIQSRSAALIPDSITQKENKYSTTLTYYHEKLYDEIHSGNPDSLKVAGYKARIFDNEQKLNEIRGYMEEHYRDYYKLKYELKPLTFKAVQRKLRRNEVLLSYTLPDNGREIYIFALSKENIQFIRQPLDNQTIDEIKTVYSSLSSSDFLNTGIQEFSAYCEAAHQLYLSLISPFNSLISEKRITIIPDRYLCYLPFEALLTEKISPATTIHYHDLPYFILRNAINYSYSAELFLANAANKIPFRVKALAFSPTYPPFSVVGNDTVRLPSIPGTLEEVQYLNHKMSTLSYTGEDATEMNFRKQAQKFQILHLAMHTLINDSVPMFSRLAFYPGNSDSLDNDGWLTTSDLYNLHLTAKMAVLSACRTGGGKLRDGEGIMSLAHGFFYAGCPSVLMSLWEVEDRSGTGIIKDFYKNLKFGKTKDEALRNAKINYIKKADPLTSHPHFWLGFIVIGNPEPLYMGPEKYLLICMVVIMLILMIDLIRKKPAGKKPAGKL